MIEMAAQIAPWARDSLMAGFVVFLRVGGAIALLPAFGEQNVPQRVRLALAIAFTLVVAPAVYPQVAPLRLGLGIHMVTEPLIGLCLGFVLRLLVMALQIAGTVAAQATSLSQILGGAGVDPQPAIGHVLLVSGLALAVMSGLHVRAAEALIASYELLPPGQMPHVSDLSAWGIGRVAWGFGLGVTLAMPFVIASLIYNLALGIINRAMPQLMVAMVGAPAITGGGLLLLLLSVPHMLELWRQALLTTLHTPFGALP